MEVVFKYEILVHQVRKKKGTSTSLICEKKIRPFIQDWYIPLTDVKDALSQFMLCTAVVQNQKTQ